MSPDRLRQSTPTPLAEVAWHALSPADALAALDTGPHGLAEVEAARRHEALGPNVLPQPKPPSLLGTYFAQFRSPFIYLLFGAAAVSLLIGEIVDAIFIFVVLQTNAAIGTYQEWKAAAEAESLRALIRNWAVVRRDGERMRIAATDLVPGDVVLVESGVLISSDVRLLESFDLEIDESLLTGESTPVTKSAETELDRGTGLADRRNMLHAGTTVGAGRGIGVVTLIGAATELGRIAQTLSKAEEVPPPLMVRMRLFTRNVATVMMALIVALAAIEIARGLGVAEVFLVAAALAVAAIPEGLPVALTVALSVAVHRMAQRHVIVRLLPAVEGLGACTYIASDKTGTLTCNELTLRRLVLAGGEAVDLSGEGYLPRG